MPAVVMVQACDWSDILKIITLLVDSGSRVGDWIYLNGNVKANTKLTNPKLNIHIFTSIMVKSVNISIHKNLVKHSDMNT